MWLFYKCQFDWECDFLFFLRRVKAVLIIYLLHQVLSPFSKTLKIHNVFSKKFQEKNTVFLLDFSQENAHLKKLTKQVHALLKWNLSLPKRWFSDIKACKKLPCSILFFAQTNFGMLCIFLGVWWRPRPPMLDPPTGVTEPLRFSGWFGRASRRFRCMLFSTAGESVVLLGFLK